MTYVKFNNQNPLAAFPFAGLNKFLKDDFLTADFFAVHPPVNIHETTGSFTVDVMAPGFSKEDFKITVEEKALTISAEKKQEAKNENEKQVRREFTSKSFKRSFTLNEQVDEAGIHAKYENGILKVTLPKKQPAAVAKKDIVVE